MSIPKLFGRRARVTTVVVPVGPQVYTEALAEGVVAGAAVVGNVAGGGGGIYRQYAALIGGGI